MIRELKPDEIFVFGSNAGGQHGGGAARFALENFGAVWGQGHGLQGRSYAIDTMSGLETMRGEVAQFLLFAAAHPRLRFLVTKVGCGIAGYSPEEVAPMFSGSPENVVLPESFVRVIRGAQA